MQYDTSSFISAADHKHGTKYDYSKVSYKNSQTKVEIICKEHGSFYQTPAKHLQGQGCPKCSYAGRGQKTTQQFVDKAKEVHHSKYDYSRVDYLGSQNKVTIICNEHGPFEQTPAHHLQGVGCPLCAGNVKRDTKEFIKEARKIHGKKYDYSKTQYINNKENVIITCPEHGDFIKQPLNHLQGYGCPDCNKTKRVLNSNIIIQEGKKLFPNYEYKPFIYRNNRQLLDIKCAQHGWFQRSVVRHLYDKLGCPACNVSTPHQRIINFLDSIDVEYKVNDRSMIYPKELDIYIPKNKLAIEINGLYYHSTIFKERGYHYDKFKAAENAGIKLLQFWDYEIRDNIELVQDMILAKLNRLTDRIYARKCNLVNIDSTTYKSFLTENHLQGAINSKIKKGLLYNGNLVAVGGFTGNHLDRLASKRGLIVVGGAGKIIKDFLKSHDTLISFSANRYSSGEVYKTLGFTLDKVNRYTLHYTDTINLYSRNQFQRHKLIEKYGDSELTAREIAEKHGFYQIWGPGTKKWTFSKV